MNGKGACTAAEGWLALDPACAQPVVQHCAEVIFAAAAGRRCGLRSAPRPHSGAVVDLDDPEVLAFITRHRLSPAVPFQSVPASWRSAFQTRLLTIYGLQLRVESAAQQVLEIFDERQIETRVLKGLATAELDHGDRSQRHTSDVDLAVRHADLQRSVQALSRYGYRPITFIHRSKHLLKGAALTAPNGVEIDLHARLFQRSPTTVDLFDEPGDQLTDLPGRALPRPLRLVHAAGHFMLAPPGHRLTSGLLDVTAMRDHGVDLDAARRHAQATDAEGLVGAALRLESRLSGRSLAGLSDWAHPSWLDRRTRLQPGRNLALEHLSRLRECPAELRLRYLPDWVIPPAPERQLFKSQIARRAHRLRTAIGRP